MPPRPLRPKDEPDASDGKEATPEPKGNKRRAVSSACLPCRKRKSKCDGQLPACSTCTAVYRTECFYDADSDHRRKGALKRDIISLQQRNDALGVIVALLRSLPETESISLLHDLRSEASPDVLAASLQNNIGLPYNFDPQTLEAEFSQQFLQPPSHLESEDRSVDVFKDQEEGQYSSDAVIPPETHTVWFTVPQDEATVAHLLDLYFCWVHPFNHLLSRDHFLCDMKCGRTEFCSALLVNALLSLACHYSDRFPVRTDAGGTNLAREYFWLEAKRLLHDTERPSLTTVQALGIMSLKESSQGRISNHYQYAGRCVRMALELGLHLPVLGSGLQSSEIEVRKITFWGVFNLETICAINVGRLSQLTRAAADVHKPNTTEHSESQVWHQYEDSSMPLSPRAEQSPHLIAFANELSQLCELASEMVNTFYATQERFTTRRLSAIYAQYQEWHQNLPDIFRVENTSLPHVFVLHMYYHSCVLHLFRPYIKLDLRNAQLYPRETCTRSANEISALMNALRASYGLRRLAVPVTSLLLSASTIHLLNLPINSSCAHLEQAILDFQEMSTNHRFAARCVGIIQSLAKKWNIALPEGAAPHRPNGQNWPSSPSSFWRAPIPQKESSRGGSRSNGSNSSNQDSPFPPPGSQHQQSSYPPFYNEPSSMGSSTHANQFWTPFPVQSMPMQSPNVVPSMSVDPSALGSSQEWQGMFNHSAPGFNSANPTSSRPDDASIREDEAMNFGNWQWQ